VSSVEKSSVPSYCLDTSGFAIVDYDNPPKRKKKYILYVYIYLTHHDHEPTGVMNAAHVDVNQFYPIVKSLNPLFE
jgi:hypothetical protein